MTRVMSTWWINIIWTIILLLYILFDRTSYFYLSAILKYEDFKMVFNLKNILEKKCLFKIYK